MNVVWDENYLMSISVSFLFGRHQSIFCVLKSLIELQLVVVDADWIAFLWLYTYPRRSRVWLLQIQWKCEIFLFFNHFLIVRLNLKEKYILLNFLAQEIVYIRQVRYFDFFSVVKLSLSPRYFLKKITLFIIKILKN